MKQSSPHADDV